jgi:cell division protease FtsH
MWKLTQNVLKVFLILLTISVVFSLFYGNPQKDKQTIPFSELVAKINRGEISAVKVRGNDLIITTRDSATFHSQKESEASLSQSLSSYGVSALALAKVNLEIEPEKTSGMVWLTVLINLVPILLIVGMFWLMTRQSQKGMMQAFTFGKANIRVFANPKEKTTFKEVAGMKEAKEELVEVVDFLKNPKKFLDIGARIPRGVLLMGAPGTGKTLLARAVAGEAGVPFFHISGSEFVELFVGVGASRVRDLFLTAKKAAPAIVFIDEIDAVGRQRGTGLGGGHDEREQTLNQILVEMDGFDRETNVIVMAATNRPDVLDPALLRPGRFDRRIILDLPDLKEREEILRLHLKTKKTDSSVEPSRVSQRTPGFSGADLANLVNEAAILAARKNRKFIIQDDLLVAMEKVILGPERKSHVLTQEERKITAYHEAGHALVAAFSPQADPVHKISIIARGRAAGYTLKLPVEDRHLYSRAHFLDELSVMLGGYVVEKIVFGDLTTGASDDLRRATELSRKLVTQYGMSDKIGPVTFGQIEELVFLGRDLMTEREYSEKVAEEIDGEVRRIMSEAQKQAQQIVSVKRKLLNEIADKLISAETIEKEEFDALVAVYQKTNKRKISRK